MNGNKKKQYGIVVKYSALWTLSDLVSNPCSVTYQMVTIGKLVTLAKLQFLHPLIRVSEKETT